MNRAPYNGMNRAFVVCLVGLMALLAGCVDRYTLADLAAGLTANSLASSISTVLQSILQGLFAGT